MSRQTDNVSQQIHNVISEKKWAQLDVTCLKDIPKDIDGKNAKKKMGQICLADDQKPRKGGVDGYEGGYEGDQGSADDVKNMLLLLVKNHGDDVAGKGVKGGQVSDVVADKGKGLVVLLYGSAFTNCPEKYRSTLANYEQVLQVLARPLPVCSQLHRAT